MIAIQAEPFNNRVYQKSSGGSATISKSITFDGAPTSLEYRLVDDQGAELQAWAEFDSSPTGGTSTLSFQSAASTTQKFVEVRKQPSLETATESIGWYVGNIVLIFGQSLAQELSFIGSADQLSPYFVWNGTDGQNTAGGRGQEELARIIVESESCAVMVVNTALGGTSLTARWNNPSDPLWTDTLSDISTVTGGDNRIYFSWWHQGTADAEAGVTESAYLAASIEFFNRVKSNIFKPDGSGVDIVYAHYARLVGAGQANSEERQAIRNAQIAVEGEVSGLIPVNAYKYELRDGVHFTGEAYEKLARQIVQTFYVYSGIVSGEPLRVLSAVKPLGENIIRITFNQSISQGTYSVEGVRVLNGGAIVPISSYSSESSNTATLTTTSSFGDSPTLTFSYGNGETRGELTEPTTLGIQAPNGDAIALNSLAISEQQVIVEQAPASTNLSPYTITALAKSDEQGTGGTNIIAGAIVSLFNSMGEAVVLYDDQQGSNGSTAKQTDSNGQVTVYVEPGLYQAKVNNNPETAALVTELLGLNPEAQRNKLGLGDSATRNVGTGINQVASGADFRIVGAAQKTSNLSDLASASAARSNLGLGDIATETKQSLLQGVRKSLLDSPLCRLFTPNKTVDALVGSLTTTRASAATYVDRYGVVKTAAIDEMREENEGWLIEGGSTNLMTYSEQFSNPVWTLRRVTVTDDAATAPDESATADFIQEDATNDTKLVFQTFSVTAGNTYAFSFFAKANGRDAVQIYLGGGVFDALAVNFDLQNGAINEVAPGDSADIKKLAGGWYRCSMTATAKADGPAVFPISLIENINSARNEAYQGDGVSGLFVWGAQVEELPFASSYIPTVATTESRSADQVSVQGDGNAPLLNGPYSVFVRASVLGYNNLNRLFTIGSSSTAGDSISGFINASGAIFSTFGLQSGQFSQTSNILSAQVSYCVTSSGGEYRQYIDGAPDDSNPVTATSAPDAKPNIISIGANYGRSSLFLFGHIQDFRVYDFELNADEAALIS